MSNGIIKNYTAGAAIAAYRIIKPGAADGQVLQGAAATDLLQGVNVQPGATASGDRIDVAHSGIHPVEAGGAIADGAWFTSDANGKAVAAAPAAGVNNQHCGKTLVTMADGDIAPALILLGQIQGA